MPSPLPSTSGPYCLLCKPDYAADAAGFCEPCDSAAARGAFAVNVAIFVVLILSAYVLYKCYKKFKKLASKKIKTAVKVRTEVFSPSMFLLSAEVFSPSMFLLSDSFFLPRRRSSSA